MLGPNKWRLLTIVAGVLLAHAIDSPNRSTPRLTQPSQSTYSKLSLSSRALISPTSTHVGLTIEKVAPSIRNSNNVNSYRERRLARNLYTPFKRFSNIDDVRYIERHQTTDLHRNDILNRRTTFGAFRYATILNENQAGRRSDDDMSASAFEYTNTTFSDQSNVDAETGGTTSSKPTTLQSIKRHKYRYIPLNAIKINSVESNDMEFNNIERTTLSDQEIRPRTDFNIIDLNKHETATQLNQEFNNNKQQNHENVAESSETVPQALALHSSSYHQSHISNKVSFPRSKPATRVTPTKAYSEINDDIQGRRSGITFTQHTPKFDPPFIPQSYQEDDPNHPDFQIPYSEELSPTEATEIRTARGAHYENYPIRSSIVHFPGPSTSNHNTKPFRDDVTKFGDVNGPITPLQQRQFNDYYDGIRTYDNIYYSDDYRRPSSASASASHQFYSSAPKSPFYDYNTEYSNQPLRSRLIVPYKSSRTPRVIFPSSDNLSTGVYNTENYNTNDNIVFR